MTIPPSTETTPLGALWPPVSSPLGHTAPPLGRAWRWPLVLSLLIIALYAALSYSRWNPWADASAIQSLLKDVNALSTHALKAFANPPWQWPSAYAVSIVAITQCLLSLSLSLKAMGFTFLAQALQQSCAHYPIVLALLGTGLWLYTLRALLHQWGWPPVARWGALTVLATHPALWASALTGYAWQGTLWTLILLKAPCLITTAPKAIRSSRSSLPSSSSALLTSSVFLGCLLGANPWLLGVYGFITAFVTVAALALFFKKSDPRCTISFATVVRPFCLTLVLLGLTSGLAALITQTPYALNGSGVSPLPFARWEWFTLMPYGGWWLMVAFVVALFFPTIAHIRPWAPHLLKPQTNRSHPSAKNNPAICWPKPFWISGVLIGLLLSSPTLSALWLCIGISQPLANLKAEAPLKGNALRWLDTLGVSLILIGLGAAVLLFQWCPDRLPWFIETDNETLVSLSLGSVAWEVAWWKLVVSGWLFSLLVLGFAILLRGYRLTGQQGLGLTAASILWIGIVFHAGILPWAQPTPTVPTGLISGLKSAIHRTGISPNLKLHPTLTASNQKIVAQTLWHGTIQAVSTSTNLTLRNIPLTTKAAKTALTLQAMPESLYYQRGQKHPLQQQAIDVQHLPVIRLWPHPSRGWLDAESIVWVLTTPSAL